MAKLTLAFLGPEGTYTHQAAYDKFGTTVNYTARGTIAGVFDAISPTVPLALIPQENSIFGSVVETYDLLRQRTIGRETFVRGEVTLAVRHCLLVRKGVKLKNVGRVMSHEQALGQCRTFLSTQIPDASLIKMSSTAAAARALLERPLQEGGDVSESAAICSKLCATLYDGLEVLYEGIQDDDLNFTRFFLLATSLDEQLPGAPCTESSPCRALLRVSTGLSAAQSSPTTVAPPASTISQLLQALAMNIMRIDRRPSPASAPFLDVYFVEIQEAGDFAWDSWTRAVHGAIQRVKDCGGEGILLGLW